MLVGNGSNELIQATLSVTLESGDRVVAPSPTFALYRLLASVLGGCYVPVPFGPDFTYDIDRLIEAAVRERAKVIVLNSPNNPTGSVLPPGAVERVLRETEALVVATKRTRISAVPARSGCYPGLRGSSCCARSPRRSGRPGCDSGLRSRIRPWREIAKAKLPYNVNLITLAAATVVLEHRAV